ncbi:unnamed protein product [Fraxinus pennsylvanica]|uniref:Glutaredoxin domain-containing protein n=1 Tax=Fraxinus pennsylvanica TaxID=56036 RepID=A0AAD1ZR64_9LAMI|nr:unnamed protein product [Fraxinus pennsylvanica]
MKSANPVQPRVCKTVITILGAFHMFFDERDVSMDCVYIEELQMIFGESDKSKLSLPRVFISGSYIGGAEELQWMLCIKSKEKEAKKEDEIKERHRVHTHLNRRRASSSGSPALPVAGIVLHASPSSLATQLHFRISVDLKHAFTQINLILPSSLVRTG